MRTAFGAALAALALCACDSLLGIDNQLPTPEGLQQERVVVRGVRVQQGIPIPEYVLDRVRYIDAGDPRSVNRVIRAVGTHPWPGLDSLSIAVGDTLLATTRYLDISRVYSAPAPIPDWRDNSKSYLIGVHSLVTVEKGGRSTRQP
jgi:hypothetical protein